MKTYILDLNLPIAKVWHPGVRVSERSKHGGVGRSQEEEAKPRAAEERLEALRDLGQNPRPSLHLSPEPPGKRPQICSPLVSMTPGDRASTRWKGSG